MDQLFNNRELAVVFWSFILLSWAFTKEGVRDSAKHVLSAFFHPIILTLFALMGGYVYLVVGALYSVGLWNYEQFKATILWFIFVASVELFKANTIYDEEGYFKKSILGHFKLLVVFEFIVAFQSYSLIAELIIVPVSSYAVLMLAYSELREEYKPVENILSWALFVFGAFMVSYGFYFIYSNFGEFAELKTLMDFTTPIILSVLLLPFIFVISVYMLYERILVRVNIYTDNKSHRMYAKFKALIHFKGDHNGLNKWLAFSCMSDFESRKKIDESIISFNIRKDEMV